jgi:ABC-type branched-subunit amino acid transport system ATPase component
MRTDPDNNRNSINGMIGVVIFFLLTILVPFLQIGGGFLWGPIGVADISLSIDLYWNEMTGIIMGLPFDDHYRAFTNPIYASIGVEEGIHLIWLIIPLWSSIWLGLGILGAVLVLIPPLMKIGKKEPIKIPLGLIGLIIGLIATMVQYGLFFLLWLVEDWGDISPHLNIFILGCFIFGWISLVNGYRYPRKKVERIAYIPAEPSASEKNITLEAENIYKYFGGVKALEGASVMVTKNKLVSLIGPNGCGKTTLFNVITSWLPKTNPYTEKEGITKKSFLVRIQEWITDKFNIRKKTTTKKLTTPDVGSVKFEGEKIDGLSAHETALTGMMRTFQTTRNWANLTVLENLLVAPFNQTGEALWKNFIFWKRIKEDERKNTLKALEVLEFLEITHIRDQVAQELSGGQLKLLAVARLLMSAPRLILLDEPMAGINPTLGNKIMDKIVNLTEEATVFLIEHNMDVVFNYSDEIFVMASGKIIAQGTPTEIETNLEVIEAYLGKDY